MFREWNTTWKTALAGACLAGACLFPLPDWGSASANRPLQRGDHVYYRCDPNHRCWEVVTFNPTGDTVVLECPTGRAIVAVWECERAE